MAIRIVGTQEDFAEKHSVQVSLSDPQLVELDVLDLPIFPLVPSPNRLPGYELSLHEGGRILFRPQTKGGYDLSFGLDGEPDHRHDATISVKLLDSN